jgi:tRNA C32,U32 (ribose-2'-O)-methylase TrmJ
MCRWIVRIPACPDYPSLNIAQAAAILLYVLAVPPAVGPPSPHARMPASVEDTEQFFGQLRTLLLDTGFLHRNNPERIMYVLRRIVQRAGPDAREIRILRGILRQLGWAFRQAGFPGGNGEGSEPVDPERFPES